MFICCNGPLWHIWYVACVKEMIFEVNTFVMSHTLGTQRQLNGNNIWLDSIHYRIITVKPHKCGDFGNNKILHKKRQIAKLAALIIISLASLVGNCLGRCSGFVNSRMPSIACTHQQNHRNWWHFRWMEAHAWWGNVSLRVHLPMLQMHASD